MDDAVALSTPRLRSLRFRNGLLVAILTAFAPQLCALTQTLLLVTLNASGVIWARHVIHDPGGMVVKNFAFLILVWVAASLPG